MSTLSHNLCGTEWLEIAERAHRLMYDSNILLWTPEFAIAQAAQRLAAAKYAALSNVRPEDYAQAFDITWKQRETAGSLLAGRGRQ